jgi:hypothetical protein
MPFLNENYFTNTNKMWAEGAYQEGMFFIEKIPCVLKKLPHNIL